MKGEMIIIPAACIVAASMCTKESGKEILREFDDAEPGNVKE